MDIKLLVYRSEYLWRKFWPSAHCLQNHNFSEHGYTRDRLLSLLHKQERAVEKNSSVSSSMNGHFIYVTGQNSPFSPIAAAAVRVTKSVLQVPFFYLSPSFYKIEGELRHRLITEILFTHFFIDRVFYNRIMLALPKNDQHAHLRLLFKQYANVIYPDAELPVSWLEFSCENFSKLAELTQNLQIKKIGRQ